MRPKALIAAAAIAALLALSGCSSQQPYTPSEATPQVSSPTIGEDGVLRVGVNSQAAPLAGTNSTGDLVGFDVDLAAALADELGLKVEVVDVGADAATALTDSSVDIVLGVDQSTTDSELWKSDSYLQTAVALFASDANVQVPTLESDPTIAVQTSSTSSWMAENQFGADALERASSLSEAFEQLTSGSVNYVASDAVRGTYVVSSNDSIDASIVALMQQPSGYCVAVLSSNVQLQNAIASALDTVIDGGMIEVLDKKWLGSEWDLSSVPLTAGATAQPKEQDEQAASEDQAGDAESSEMGTNAVTPEDVAAA